MKNSEAILVTPKQFEIQECPVPEPKDHEILMKVEYVGMCGSDIHGFEFGPFIPPKDPNQKIGLGHEVAGEVVKVGSKVTRFKAGDKVLIEPGVPDDKCEYCRTGRYNICPDVDFMATQPNYKGALTQYMTHPEEWTYHIPEGMTTMEAALVEPAAVGMHAAILGGAQLGKSIVILGGGTIGLMVLQACKSLVARGGKIMMVGTQSKPVPIDFLKINREVMIQTSFRYCNNFPQTIEAIASGKFNVKDMVTNIYDYKDVQQAFMDDIDPENKANMVKCVIKVSD